MRAGAVLLTGLVALAGCGNKAAGGYVGPSATGANIDPQAHTPDFARRPNVPFGREEAVAITLREWRLFGSPVDDDPPDSRPPPRAQDKPERQPGLWERVGEYWWGGLDAGAREASWTGKHDEFGQEFAATSDSSYPWSAAFISYVMRIAGAGSRFPYSAAHATYINAAWGVAHGRDSSWVVSAERADAYPPQAGDMICHGRSTGKRTRYDDLPTSFPGHCQIVVQVAPGMLGTIGGNVDDSVTMIHVPTTADGLVAYPGGQTVDTRYPWFVVLRVLYDNPTVGNVISARDLPTRVASK